MKPENILLGADGHVVLTDYGLAKADVRDHDAARTVCGTNEYMAPEMLLRKGYGPAVDWWALGALVVEMLTGHPPFRARDPAKLYAKILNDKVALPSWLTSECAAFARGLLDRNVETRLGSGKSTMFAARGTAAVKAHPWMKVRGQRGRACSAALRMHPRRRTC